MSRKSIYFIILTFLSFFLFTLFVHAADTQVANAKYVPLAPIYTPDNVQVGAQGDIGSYFSEMYQLGVGIATALAVLMVIWGGVEYVTTDAIGGKEEGKQKVQNAILGLLLALGSYLILQTINPKLLETNLTIDKIDTAGITVKTGALPVTTAASTNAWSGWNQTKQDNLDAAWALIDAGVDPNNLPQNLKDAYNEAVANQANQDAINNQTAAKGFSSGGGNGTAGWGNANAQSNQGQTLDGRFSYYGPNETSSARDSQTAAWHSATGQLVLLSSDPNIVSSSGSSYYPAGTIWSTQGTNGATYYHVVDDNNIGSNGVPVNQQINNNHTFDLPTSQTNPGVGYPETGKITVNYVPSSKLPNSQVNSFHDLTTLKAFLQSQGN